MGKLKQLTEEEANERLYWLRHHASFDLDQAIYRTYTPHGIDAKVIEKLHEISRVAREVANYYTPPLEPDYMSARQAEMLYNADPDCRHVHDNNRGPMASGIKCARCPGWFCY